MYKNQYVVDLAIKTCSCRRWQLNGIPCLHAIASIYRKHLEPIEFVRECYTKRTYEKIYQFIINPINGLELWDKIEHPCIVPPKYHKQPDRPKKKKRRKEHDEAIKGTNKLRRFYNVIKCIICGEEGHYVRTCIYKRNERYTQKDADQYKKKLKSTKLATIAPSPS